MALEYKRIELRKPEDIDLAERLVEKGWRIVQSSIFALLLERRTPRRERRHA